MSKVLVIGCGGVASVAIQKCCQVSEVFTDLCIASRTKSKCDRLAAELAGKTATRITPPRSTPTTCSRSSTSSAATARTW